MIKTFLAPFPHLLPALALALALLLPPSAQALANSKYASIVIDADSGEVLHASNADARKYPASLTKMMTLYMVFDGLSTGKLKLNQSLPVSRHASRQSPSKLGLRPGQSIQLEDAILALVTKSANDVAVVVAEAIGGSERNFATMMTRKAHALGARKTTFRNASGLPDRGQLSTARDMALLAQALIRNHGDYYHYFSTAKFNYGGRTLTTHNRVMLRYKGADGIKTGYISASGFNLVASAKRNGRRIIGVVFGGKSSRSRDAHMVDLLDRGFSRLGTSIREAKAEPVAKPKLAAIVDAHNYGIAGMGDADEMHWSIQVGAFSQYSMARQAASKASKHLAGLVSANRITVVPLKGKRSTLYRARLVGITEDQARSACRQLERSKGMDCLVLQPAT